METLPEVLPLLLQTSHSIYNMFAKDCLAPARVDACPIQFEAVGAAIIKPNRQLYLNAPYPGVESGVVSMRITIWLRHGLVQSSSSMREYTPSRRVWAISRATRAGFSSAAISTRGLSRSSYYVLKLIASMSALVVLSSERASKLVSMVLESILAHV